MFFDTFWQGLVFGFVTMVAMLTISAAFALAWRKYEHSGESQQQQSCDAHH